MTHHSRDLNPRTWSDKGGSSQRDDAPSTGPSRALNRHFATARTFDRKIRALKRQAINNCRFATRNDPDFERLRDACAPPGPISAHQRGYGPQPKRVKRGRKVTRRRLPLPGPPPFPYPSQWVPLEVRQGALTPDDGTFRRQRHTRPLTSRALLGFE